MTDYKAKVAELRKIVKASCKSLRVQRDRGTAYGWVTIWANDYSAFTDEESQTLDNLGLNYCGNCCSIEIKDLDVILARIEGTEDRETISKTYLQAVAAGNDESKTPHEQKANQIAAHEMRKIHPWLCENPDAEALRAEREADPRTDDEKARDNVLEMYTKYSRIENDRNANTEDQVHAGNHLAGLREECPEHSEKFDEIDAENQEEESGGRGRSDYEERQESRRERFEMRADKARQKAKSSYKSASQLADSIPMGQPILVGHHSEKRARRDQDKIHRQMRVAHESDKKAQRLEDRARSVGQAGISSDDPEAVQKLQAKIDADEDQRDKMKALNRSYKKRKGDWAAIQKDTGMSSDLIESAKRGMASATWEKNPIPAYALTNLGANIRRMKKRIESMRQEAATEPRTDIQGEGYKVVENTDINRLQIVFDGKPPADVRKKLKSNGFRWSPREGAWQRLLNNNARHTADYLLSNM